MAGKSRGKKPVWSECDRRRRGAWHGRRSVRPPKSAMHVACRMSYVACRMLHAVCCILYPAGVRYPVRTQKGPVQHSVVRRQFHPWVYGARSAAEQSMLKVHLTCRASSSRTLSLKSISCIHVHACLRRCVGRMRARGCGNAHLRRLVNDIGRPFRYARTRRLKVLLDVAHIQRGEVPAPVDPPVVATSKVCPKRERRYAGAVPVSRAERC